MGVASMSLVGVLIISSTGVVAMSFTDSEFGVCASVPFVSFEGAVGTEKTLL